MKPIFSLAILCLMLVGSMAPAQITNPGAYEKLKQDTTIQVQTKLNPLLSRYCGDACEIIKTEVEVDEEIPEGEDLGFESVSNEGARTNYFVSRVSVHIQVDDRVTSKNQERLEAILQNHLQTFGLNTEILWKAIRLPNIGRSQGGLEQLKEKLESRLESAVKSVIEEYCPSQCILAQIDIVGSMVTLDEASALDRPQKVIDEESRTAMRIDEINIEINMDESLDESERLRIGNVFRTKTRFASPVNLNINVTAFPETYAEKRLREKKEADDPYGLEKLRNMLQIFRDLAGTKEIITKESSMSSSQMNSQSSNTERDQSNSTSTIDQKDKGQPFDWQIAAYIGGGILLLGLILLVAMRILSANRDAKMLLSSADMQDLKKDKPTQPTDQPTQEQADVSLNAKERENLTPEKKLRWRLQVDQLKEELVKLFIDNPKVAKETFSRLLTEDGVEETAKYVYLFGQMVVFELLDDPNLQRDLFTLSEYFRKSNFDFTTQEEFDLLQKLKTRCTASEIKLLTRKSTEKFEFLNKLDPTQLYSLISEENPQVQSIVLTQLDRKNRMSVFDMYQGEAKVNLMAELSRADAIPKEYLFNVAKALNKKVQSRAEFDTENLRASDILLDLLEKADLAEQRQLMRQLRINNPETARGIKLKLVTVEMLPFLKDGHLLELIMGMERDDLLSFLTGTRDHIRNLLINKAPRELAESWLEELEYKASVSDENYRLVELKILGKLRNLANTGAINILDINEMIFDEAAYATPQNEQVLPNLSRGSMVA